VSEREELNEWHHLRDRLEVLFDIPRGLTPDELGDEMRKVAVRLNEALGLEEER